MLSQAELNALLEYDPISGSLTFKARPGTDRATKSWNAKHAGKLALNIPFKGYRRGSLENKELLAHRVIWKMVFGSEPPEIDHINGDRSDNRISNLRAVTREENQRNSSIRKDNTTGVVGVYWYKKSRKWLAKIRNSQVGYFDTRELAIAARKEAELAHGFHANHGKRKGTAA